MRQAAIPAEQKALMGVQSDQLQVAHLGKEIGPIDTSILLRKGIYDKVAAQVILQRFLDFYNSEDDVLVVDSSRRTKPSQ